MKSMKKPDTILLPGENELEVDSIPVYHSLVDVIGSEYTGIAFVMTVQRYCWFQDGWLHRTNGPAMYCVKTKQKGFYLQGKLFLPENWFEALTESEQECAIWNMNVWR